jgi:glycosyl transferase family 1
VMPSFYEGLPIALLESMACGCVPVVSRLPGITDYAVQDGESGVLVKVGDSAGFADAIARLYRDPTAWSRMSDASHIRAQSCFSVQAMGTSYLRLIEEALKGQYPLPRSRKLQRAFDPSVFSWRDFVPDSLRRYGQRGRRWWRTEGPWASTFKA